SPGPSVLPVAEGETRLGGVERAEHRCVGLENLFQGRGPARDLVTRIELYRREVSNPLARYENLYEPINTFPEVEPDRVRVAPDSSVAEGIELLLRGRLGQRTGWWINYALSSTEDVIAGERFPRQFDQTHAVNLDLDLRLSPRWSVNLAWRYHTGWPTTPLTVERRTGDDGSVETVPVLGRRFSDRLPDYHRLDLRASRRWAWRSTRLRLFLDVQNVYDRANLAGFDYEIDDETGTLIDNRESWPGFLPSLGVEIEF
ncbi:MAG: TonB-dependent receptor, partial [Thermoanaerobaculia bacterium]|nr:TonB-dependent receptor [Thermoanaerobaculia bacterium]